MPSDDDFDDFDETMNEDRQDISIETGGRRHAHTIDNVERVDSDTIRIIVEIGSDRVTRDLTSEDAREYRAAFNVDSVSEFIGEQVMVTVAEEGEERRITGPSTS